MVESIARLGAQQAKRETLRVLRRFNLHHPLRDDEIGAINNATSSSCTHRKAKRTLKPVWGIASNPNGWGFIWS
jgi:hypothetical protein